MCICILHVHGYMRVCVGACVGACVCACICVCACDVYVCACVPCAPVCVVRCFARFCCPCVASVFSCVCVLCRRVVHQDEAAVVALLRHRTEQSAQQVGNHAGKSAATCNNQTHTTPQHATSSCNTQATRAMTGHVERTQQCARAVEQHVSHAHMCCCVRASVSHLSMGQTWRWYTLTARYEHVWRCMCLCVMCMSYLHVSFTAVARPCAVSTGPPVHRSVTHS